MNYIHFVHFAVYLNLCLFLIHSCRAAYAASEVNKLQKKASIEGQDDTGAAAAAAATNENSTSSSSSSSSSTRRDKGADEKEKAATFAEGMMGDPGEHSTYIPAYLPMYIHKVH